MQKALEALKASKAIQQIIFTYNTKWIVVNARVKIYYILKQSKETILQLSKGTKKVL